jgi:hypothetical protein
MPCEQIIVWNMNNYSNDKIVFHKRVNNLGVFQVDLIK